MKNKFIDIRIFLNYLLQFYYLLFLFNLNFLQVLLTLMVILVQESLILLSYPQFHHIQINEDQLNFQQIFLKQNSQNHLQFKHHLLIILNHILYQKHQLDQLNLYHLSYYLTSILVYYQDELYLMIYVIHYLKQQLI